MAQEIKVVSHDELQDKAEKVFTILKKRETGLFAWHMMLNEGLKELHDILCPLFGHK